MAVDYVLVEKESPLDRGGAKKTYAQAVSNGTVTFDELAEEVAGTDTWHYPLRERIVKGVGNTKVSTGKK